MNKKILLFSLFVPLVLGLSFNTSSEERVFRIGLIGLDTSHVTAFSRYINDSKKDHPFKVVAAFPGGSPDLPASADRLEGFTSQVRDRYGVEIVDSIEEVCRKSDGILLTSVDGRPHLEQVKPVLQAKKPVFIDKPAAGSLSEVMEIFELAKESGVPCWSSSSLRFSPGILGMRDHEQVGKVLGCIAYSPCTLEEHHPDLYWYGIHGVEILFTIMGRGCETVQRVQTEDFESVVGVWNDGRIGTFRGIRKGKKDYGALVFGTKGIAPSGKYAGYGPLCDEILNFFETGVPPVSPDETIEIYAFMSAADASKASGGASISIREVMEEAKRKEED